MITTIQNSDVLSPRSGVIIHGCNLQGVMGSGVAKHIRTKYPDVYKDYLDAFNFPQRPQLGDILITQVDKFKYIISAMTQEFYGRDGILYVQYDALREAFRRTNTFLNSLDARLSLHFPKIGCGLAGGDWKIVSTIIEEEVPLHEKYLHLYTL